jgi:hypothetical protein
MTASSSGLVGLGERLDWVAAARGASTVLSVLLIGGLVQPLVGLAVPVLGTVWLILVAVAAFVVAGLRRGSSDLPALQGALTAVLGYLFVLPLVAFATRGLDLAQVAATTTTAVVVGGLTGALAARRRSSQARKEVAR